MPTIISRAEARKLGAKKYFTGKPCKNGGLGFRWVSTGTCCCPVCEKAKSLARERYSQDNAERIKSSRFSYYKKNRERLIANRKEYRVRNPEVDRNYRARHPEKVQESLERYASRNPDKGAHYYERNKQSVRSRNRLWGERNRPALARLAAKRRAAKRRSIPSWFGDYDQLVLSEAYRLAAQRTRETGFAWHVDHLVPLQAKSACGLHCADNVQVIPAAMNTSKQNKLTFSQPGEWIRRGS